MDGVGARGIALALALASFSIGERAEAFERQQHLGGGIGGALLKSDGAKLAVGGSAFVHYTYGIKDNWNFLAEAGGAIVPMKLDLAPASGTSTATLFAWSGAAGIAYAFDVLEWVPYVGLLAGGYLLHGDARGDVEAAPGVQAALGLDYQLSRSFALGIAARQHFMLTKLDAIPVYTTAILRAEYVWGW